MGSSFHHLPRFQFGERFRVTSRSGNEYVVRYLASGEADSGVFVRLDNGQIARLDPRRLQWSTFEKADDEVDRVVVRKGDEVSVNYPAGLLTGKLAEDLGEGEMLRLDNGLCVAYSDVKSVSLLFRAPELRVGDRFRVKSNSGRDYSGKVLGLNAKQAAVRLTNREQVSLRLKGLNVDTLYVEIPVPQGVYRPKKG